MDREADPAAVAAMVAGDPAGLEAAYRRYADRLYTYARSIVDDGDTAADVVQETFVVAQQRVRQLRDPARLGSWLYAIARNECLARLRARRRTVMLAESHEPVLDTDPGRALHAAQVRELVQAASAGMNDGDREVIELTVRHGLSAAEVAQVLDISDKHAHARISRARDQFEGALGALLLARDGRGRCPRFDDIVAAWDGSLTPLLRKRIERHARDCELCARRRRERMDPAALLAGYAAVPFLAVAPQLWQGIRLRLVGSATPGGGDPASYGGEPPTATTPSHEPPTVPMQPGTPTVPMQPGTPTVPMQPGAPTVPMQQGPAPTTPMPQAAPPTVPLTAGPASRPAPTQPRRPTARILVVAAVAVLLIVGGVVAVRLLTLHPGAVADPAPAQTSQTSPAPPTSPATNTTPPSPPVTEQPLPPFTVTASAQWVCASPRQLKVTAHAHGAAFAAATVHWLGGGSPSLPMDVDGLLAERQFDPGGSASTVRWWVSATSADGRTHTTSPQNSVTTCF